MKKVTLKFKTIILSDVHLGSPYCQIEKVNKFLKHSSAPKIILNGDIIDGWSLKRQGGWKSDYMKFIRIILKRVEKKGVEVIYLRGNHDDILECFLPVTFGGLRVVEEYIHEGRRGKYLAIHGDVFDSITQNTKWLSVLGDAGYQLLMWMNRFYNRYRAWRGKEYYSLSKKIKSKVKQAVSFISSFEAEVEKLARKRGCKGIMCGHIHTPENKMIGDIHYLNSGDWVESNTALVEHFDGSFEVLSYDEFCRRLGEREKEIKENQISSRTYFPTREISTDPDMADFEIALDEEL